MELKMILERLEGIATEVSDINQSGKLLKMNLLGGYEGETVHGRIPKLEVQMLDVLGRVTNVEVTQIRWKAYGAAVAVLSGFVSAVVTSAALYILQHMGTH
jgi:hypothetical protein